ncbi:hypothetical protein [uncultured Jannaschia sp.]|uniref:hypothetical protein n=1 Tax=uncultured Jannaschia sp. TaxID=293347 RepID=UPI002629EFF4|nr:hypothetical protein [uncultured Jannaschia sp.]
MDATNVLVTVGAAAIGGWIGFLLAKWRDDRLRAVNLTMSLKSNEFVRVRLRVLEVLRRQDVGRSEVADFALPQWRTFRLELTEVFNRYDLICFLLDKGDLSRTVFERYLRTSIAEDYASAQWVFAAMEGYSILDGGDIRRPFFPCIRRALGRTRPREQD